MQFEPPLTLDGKPAPNCSVKVERVVATHADKAQYAFTVANESDEAAGRVWAFRVPVRAQATAIRVRSPEFWEAHLVLCDDGLAICAVEWRALGGLHPGFTKSGFVIELPPEPPILEQSTLTLQGCTIHQLQPIS